RLRHRQLPPRMTRSRRRLPAALAGRGLPAPAAADDAALARARPPDLRPPPGPGGGLRGPVDGTLRRLPGLAQPGALRRRAGVRPSPPGFRAEPALRADEPPLPALAPLPRGAEAAPAPGALAAAGVRHERERVLVAQPHAGGRHRRAR